MDDKQITEGLRKIMMAGIGAVTTGVEKSQEVIDKYAEKGKATFEQAKSATKDAAEKVKKAYDESGIPEWFSPDVTKEMLLDAAQALSKDDMIWLRDALQALIDQHTDDDEPETDSASSSENADQPE